MWEANPSFEIVGSQCVISSRVDICINLPRSENGSTQTYRNAFADWIVLCRNDSKLQNIRGKNKGTVKRSLL